MIETEQIERIRTANEVAKVALSNVIGVLCRLSLGKGSQIGTVPVSIETLLREMQMNGYPYYGSLSRVAPGREALIISGINQYTDGTAAVLSAQVVKIESMVTGFGHVILSSVGDRWRLAGIRIRDHEHASQQRIKRLGEAMASGSLVLEPEEIAGPFYLPKNFKPVLAAVL